MLFDGWCTPRSGVFIVQARIYPESNSLQHFIGESSVIIESTFLLLIYGVKPSRALVISERTRNSVYYCIFCILEPKNLTQQVLACFFLLWFSPFWITSCWQMLCLERNNPAIIPQNIEFKVNYKLSLHHQYYWRNWKHIYISKQSRFD